MVAVDRLITFNEGMDMRGFRSRTSGYREIKSNPDFPRPIVIGRNVFFLESEMLAHIKKLADGRGSQTQTAQQQPVRERVCRMIEQRRAKALKGAV